MRFVFFLLRVCNPRLTTFSLQHGDRRYGSRQGSLRHYFDGRQLRQYGLGNHVGSLRQRLGQEVPPGASPDSLIREASADAQLQFQISVNITAVVITFISAVASSDETSVLTAVQLLWVNLIMECAPPFPLGFCILIAYFEPLSSVPSLRSLSPLTRPTQPP